MKSFGIAATYIYKVHKQDSSKPNRLNLSESHLRSYCQTINRLNGVYLTMKIKAYNMRFSLLASLQMYACNNMNRNGECESNHDWTREESQSDVQSTENIMLKCR